MDNFSMTLPKTGKELIESMGNMTYSAELYFPTSPPPANKSQKMIRDSSSSHKNHNAASVATVPMAAASSNPTGLPMVNTKEEKPSSTPLSTNGPKMVIPPLFRHVRLQLPLGHR